MWGYRDFYSRVCLYALLTHTYLSAGDLYAESITPAASAIAVLGIGNLAESHVDRHTGEPRVNEACTPPHASQTRVATRLTNNPTNLGKIKWVAGSVTARNAQVGPEQLTDRQLPVGTVSAYNSLIPRTTEYLLASGFGFNVPQTARIMGIVVDIGKKQSILGRVNDAELRLVIDGMPAGDNLALAEAWPTEERVTVYGSVANLWGVELAPSTVNADTFGIALSASMEPFGNFQTAEVSSVSTTIHWQCP